MAGNNEGTIEIPFEIENKEDVKKLLEQYRKETELSAYIEMEIKDIFRFMWERKIFKIESIFTENIKLVMTVEKGTDGADNDK